MSDMSTRVNYVAQTIKFPSNKDYSLILLNVYDGSPIIPDRHVALINLCDVTNNLRKDYLRSTSDFLLQLSTNRILFVDGDLTSSDYANIKSEIGDYSSPHLSDRSSNDPKGRHIDFFYENGKKPDMLEALISVLSKENLPLTSSAASSASAKPSSK